MLEFFKILQGHGRESAYAFIIDGDSSHPHSVEELEDQLIDSDDFRAQSFLLKGRKITLVNSTLENQNYGVAGWLTPRKPDTPDRIFFIYRNSLPATLERLKDRGWDI